MTQVTQQETCRMCKSLCLCGWHGCFYMWCCRPTVSIWLLESLCIVYTHVGVCVCGNDFLFAADVWVPVRSVWCFVQVERPQTVLEWDALTPGKLQHSLSSSALLRRLWPVMRLLRKILLLLGACLHMSCKYQSNALDIPLEGKLNKWLSVLCIISVLFFFSFSVVSYWFIYLIRFSAPFLFSCLPFAQEKK